MDWAFSHYIDPTCRPMNQELQLTTTCPRYIISHLVNRNGNATLSLSVKFDD